VAVPVTDPLPCVYCRQPGVEEFLGQPVCRSCNIRQRLALERATQHKVYLHGVEQERLSPAFGP
jgi:hypothetical protein